MKKYMYTKTNNKISTISLFFKITLSYYWSYRRNWRHFLGWPSSQPPTERKSLFWFCPLSLGSENISGIPEFFRGAQSFTLTLKVSKIKLECDFRSVSEWANPESGSWYLLNEKVLPREMFCMRACVKIAIWIKNNFPKNYIKFV